MEGDRDIRIHMWSEKLSAHHPAFIIPSGLGRHGSTPGHVAQDSPNP